MIEWLAIHHWIWITLLVSGAGLFLMGVIQGFMSFGSSGGGSCGAGKTVLGVILLMCGLLPALLVLGRYLITLNRGG